ncbi:intermembrane phospholipid transport protein YdbH family protein [Sphingomonas sp. Leaf17]|uniref:intermembrane phospholipid transport protein YdbH family protein n=1 Tax=Sphingomonas sp. Leaf17 TaxID=1735683 RepID=UPI001F31F4CE|nr:YdbH domain-containing protein [Sphingomonas sp. Leaf17]
MALWLRVILALALLVLIALVVAWTQRRTIASDVIDRTLAAKGVPVRYRIADLGLGGQRLLDVVIGDPANPDLVADWVETRTSIDLSGARVTGLRAGHVRMRGRVVGGKVSLGAIDRLLPPPSGKPFALPSIDLDLADGRMRLETPAGLVGLRLAGAGRLDDGFRGTLAVVSDRLKAGSCIVEKVAAPLRVSIRKAAPTVTGPIRLGMVACGPVTVRQVSADLDLALGAALDRWQGQARLTTAGITHPAARLAGTAGTVRFAGSAAATRGAVDLTGTSAVAAQARAKTVAIAGTYRIGSDSAFEGKVRVGGVSIASALVDRATGWGGSGAGTPVAPLVAQLADAIRRAGRGFDGDADIAVRLRDGRGGARVSRLGLAAASGARVALDGGSGVTLGWPGARVRLDTTLATSGGGLPVARVSLAQAQPGAPVRGLARIAPYAAGGASLALSPVTFSATASGVTRIATRATLSGPLGDGRVDGLALPINALWDGRARLVVNPACAPLAVRRLAVSGLVLDPARITLCPVDGALLRVNGGTVGGGARIAGARLGGRLGTTPLTLAASGSTLRLSDRGFAIDGLAARLGNPDRVTRLDFATLTGRLAGGGLGGAFTGGGGQIGNVPLVLSAADGRWGLTDGRLSVNGVLMVADAAAEARFKPLRAQGVALTLVDGRIATTGTLVTPDAGVTVATVRIDHALSSGTGDATLAVPGLTFGDGLQPDQLTRLTFGVIADVKGTVTGEGHIAWTPAGVRSTGVFRTAGTDLAAAFGPVSGIRGEIRFKDLLALESEPGQVATIASVNPGIAVTDGTIRYQTYADSRVLVESGRWPFAGGLLTLDPTLLDFSAPGARRMTFRINGAGAGAFLQQFSFQNISATGIFDGTLPMIFDEKGGRIENGTLKVRPGGGTLAYVGAISQKDLGVWANLAFQALKSLRYRDLSIVMNGALAGEMVTEVKFAGISQGEGAKSNFLIRRLQKLPFVFNIRIKAPFRGLLDSALSFYDPKRLIERNLPNLLDEQNKRARPPTTPGSVQPPASETVP